MNKSIYLLIGIIMLISNTTFYFCPELFGINSNDVLKFLTYLSDNGGEIIILTILFALIGLPIWIISLGWNQNEQQGKKEM